MGADGRISFEVSLVQHLLKEYLIKFRNATPADVFGTVSV